MVLCDPGTNADVLTFGLKTAGPNGPEKPTPITRRKFLVAGTLSVLPRFIAIMP
jgi:hypothetical protein